MARKKQTPSAKKTAKKDNSTLMFVLFGAAMALMLLWLILSNTGALEHLGDQKFRYSLDGYTEYQKVSCYDAVDVYYGYSEYYRAADGGTARLDYDKNGQISLATFYNAQGDASRVLSASKGAFTTVTENTCEYDSRGNMTSYTSVYGRVDGNYVRYDAPSSPVTYAYTYDEAGNMTSRVRTGSNGETRTSFENVYDGGALASVTELDKDGVVVQKTVYSADGVRQSVETYSDGKLAEREVFDGKGNMTRHLFYSDGAQQLGEGNIYTYDYNTDGTIAVKYDASDDSSSYNYYYVYEYPKA